MRPRVILGCKLFQNLRIQHGHIMIIRHQLKFETLQWSHISSFFWEKMRWIYLVVTFSATIIYLTTITQKYLEDTTPLFSEIIHLTKNNSDIYCFLFVVHYLPQSKSNICNRNFNITLHLHGQAISFNVII